MAYGVAAWSIVHGLATLWLNGNLPAQLGDDPEEITRVVAAHLDPPRRDPALAGRQPGKAVGGRIADSTHGGGKLMPYVRADVETEPGAEHPFGNTAKALIRRRSRRSGRRLFARHDRWAWRRCVTFYRAGGASAPVVR
jgi:hypothetical protein